MTIFDPPELLWSGTHYYYYIEELTNDINVGSIIRLKMLVKEDSEYAKLCPNYSFKLWHAGHGTWIDDNEGQYTDQLIHGSKYSFHQHVLRFREKHTIEKILE